MALEASRHLLLHGVVHVVVYTMVCQQQPILFSFSLLSLLPSKPALAIQNFRVALSLTIFQLWSLFFNL